MGWRIEFDLDALKDLERLDKPVQRRITRYLRERLASMENPRQLGAPLQGPLSGLWKYRVGDYRVICRLEDAALVVLVVAVGHRREVYRP